MSAELSTSTSTSASHPQLSQSQLKARPRSQSPDSAGKDVYLSLTPALEQMLPLLNFGYDDLRERMVSFSSRFTKFMEQSRKNSLETKNEFNKRIGEDKDRLQNLFNEVETFENKERQLRMKMQKEDQEIEEAENEIAEMEKKQQMKSEHVESLIAQIEEKKQAVALKRAMRLKEKMALEAQASRNLPELMFWEDHLGMKIGGAGVTENGEPVADHLKITFTNIDNSKADKEHWFVLCFITREYEVSQCHPELGPDDLATVVNRFNDHRKFSIFLKEMRYLFKKSANRE